MRIESGIQRARPLQRSYEQPGCHDDHEAERHLRNDERVPEPRSASGTLRVVLQRGHDVSLRRLECRCEAREHGCHEREARREGDHAAVERQRDFDRKRQHRKRRGDERRHPPRQQQTGCTREREQQHRFGQQLTHEPRTPRADGQPHGDFPSPSRGTREQDTRDVRARDHQHQRHHSHQQRKEDGHRCAGAWNR